MQVVSESLLDWLKSFSKAVREREFATGKRLFDADVTAFGTVCFRVDSLEELAAHQWQAVWPRTADFDFDYATARAVVEGNLATVAAEWQSTGFGEAQKPFLRRGRATLVLKKSPADWKAIHTHFSIGPSSTSPHDPLLRHLGSSTPAPRVS